MVDNAREHPIVPGHEGQTQGGGDGLTGASTRPTLALAAVAAAAFLWALAAVVARRLFDDGVDPLELVEARAVLSAVGLALIPSLWRGPRGGLRQAVVLGLAIALVNAAYYLAIERLAVAVAIVLQYTGPAFLVGWTALVERRPPGRDVVASLVLAFAGVVLVSEVLGGEIGELDLLGILFGVAAAILFATYTLQSERAERRFGAVGALARAFAVAAVFWIVVQVPQGWPHALFEADHIASVVFVGLGGTLAPFLLYIWAIGHLRSERAVIAATLEPLFAGLIAWVWLDQVLGPLQLAGAVLILVAVTTLQTRSKVPLLAAEP